VAGDSFGVFIYARGLGWGAPICAVYLNIYILIRKWCSTRSFRRASRSLAKGSRTWRRRSVCRRRSRTLSLSTDRFVFSPPRPELMFSEPEACTPPLLYLSIFSWRSRKMGGAPGPVARIPSPLSPRSVAMRYLKLRLSVVFSMGWTHGVSWSNGTRTRVLCENLHRPRNGPTDGCRSDRGGAGDRALGIRGCQTAVGFEKPIGNRLFLEESCRDRIEPQRNRCLSASYLYRCTIFCKNTRLHTES